MQHQDETLDSEPVDDNGAISSFDDDREPQVTADGYDYSVLLYHFQEVVDRKEGMVSPQPGAFMAPGPSCTFTVH